MTKTCVIVGCPMDSGKRRKGCLMGPDSYRTAGIVSAIEDLGITVTDLGNLHPEPVTVSTTLPDHLVEPLETIAWTNAISDAGAKAFEIGVPLFLGGDHALSLGSGLAAARYAHSQNRPIFVLWLDAHSDFHTPHTTASGNLHGTPVAYLTGHQGFDGFPVNTTPVPEENVAMIGLRSVDGPERAKLQNSNVHYFDMRSIDEQGIAPPLRAFLDDVRAVNGMLHVSLDVDFLDPSFAPAVGTTVPGGATMREAHLVMEILHDSGLMTSMDLVELNPFLDERGRTAQVMVDLAASAFGRRVFDRPTLSYVPELPR